MFHNPLTSGSGAPETMLDSPYVRRPAAADARSQTVTASALPALLWQARSWIATGVVAGLMCGSLFLILATPRYTAQAQLLINPNDLRVIENSVTESSGPADANLAEVESQVRVLVSEQVLRKVVQTLHLSDDPEFTGSLTRLKAILRQVTDTFGLVSESGTVDKPLEALRTLSGMVGSRREERTYVVDLTVTTAEPKKSVEIADAIVAAYLEAQGQARTAAAQRATGELSARLDELKDRVRDAEDRVATFKAQNGISTSPNGLLSDQQLGEVSTQLVAARARTSAAKARYDQIQAVLAGHADVGALTEAVQSPTISGLRLQYADVVRRQAELSGQLGARHPSVIDIKAQVQLMKSLIEAEVRRLAQASHGDYLRALADQTALAKSLDSQTTRNQATDQSLVRLRELDRDVEASRTVYQAFLVRSRETSQQEQMNTANVRVISEATLPEKTYPPKAVLVLLVAALAGAAAGGGLAVLLPNLAGGVLTPRRDYGREPAR